MEIVLLQLRLEFVVRALSTQPRERTQQHRRNEAAMDNHFVMHSSSCVSMRRPSLSPTRVRSVNADDSQARTHFLGVVAEASTPGFGEQQATEAICTKTFGAWPSSRSCSPLRRCPTSKGDPVCAAHSPSSPLSAPMQPVDGSSPAALPVTDVPVAKEIQELKVQELLARVQVLERRLSALGTAKPAIALELSPAIRLEIAQAFQSELPILRQSFAAELREAMRVADERLTAHVDQLVKPCSDRFRDLEQRLERQLSTDTATLAGLLARCQELAAELQVEVRERQRCLETLRDDLLQNIQESREQTLGSVADWSANLDDKVLHSTCAALEKALDQESAPAVRADMVVDGAALHTRLAELLENYRAKLRDDLQQARADERATCDLGERNRLPPAPFWTTPEQLRAEIAAQLSKEMEAERGASSRRFSDMQASVSLSLQEGAAAAAEAVRLRETLGLVEAQMGTAVEEVAACCQDLYSATLGGGQLRSGAPTACTGDSPSIRSNQSTDACDMGSLCGLAIGGDGSLGPPGEGCGSTEASKRVASFLRPEHLSRCATGNCSGVAAS